MIQKDEAMKDIVLEKVIEEFGEKATTFDIMEKAIRQKSIILPFIEPDPYDMLDIDEKEKIATDTSLFSSYNGCVMYGAPIHTLISVVTQPYENVIKFEFQGEEIVIGLSEPYQYSSETKKSRCSATFLIKINSKERLHIENNNRSDKSNKFEATFINYEDSLDKYDLENSSRYGEYFSDRIPKNEEKSTSVKYKLNDDEKEFLVNINNIYDFPFTLVLKDGVMCIHSTFFYFFNLEKDVEEICCFVDFIFKIIERFMR